MTDLEFWKNTTGKELTIGSQVKVDTSNAGAADWKSDWVDSGACTVTGIVVNPKTGKANIYLEYSGEVYDEFSVEDLLPVL